MHLKRIVVLTHLSAHEYDIKHGVTQSQLRAEKANDECLTRLERIFEQ